ncbi:MAG: DUF4923 family protein [Bacteroidaceae bacterium]|jgi:hypothetical protein|nr:DUF4923 family protein [Bacteroidaceae bacterium]
MKKILIALAMASAVSVSASAQGLSGLLKTLTGGNKAETETTTEAVVETQDDKTTSTAAGTNVLGNVLGNLAGATTNATTDDNSAASGLLGGLLGTLAGNGNTSANEDGTALTNNGIVSGLLGSVLNAFTPVTQKTIIGTWNFKGSAFVFESENALAGLGSDAIASQVEAKVDSYLAKLKIQEGSCSITFNEDNTCIFTAGKRTLNGTYEFNPETKELKLSYVGLLTTTAYLVYDAGTINIVYQSDGLLRILKAIGSMSTNGTLALLNTLLDQYNGLRIGMAFYK